MQCFELFCSGAVLGEYCNVMNDELLLQKRHLYHVYASAGYMKKDDDAISSSSSRKGGWRAYAIVMVLDIFFIVLPILLFLTVLSEWAVICGVSLMIMLLLFILVKRFSSGSFDSGHEPINYIRKVISSYRVSMMIVTCLCILAVDFKIYPRRYAKTETYGTGLVHVGEYGVHWNFFFTLAAVSILTMTINIHPQYCGFVGLSIIIGYQICLICGLNEYLLSKERTAGIISQNKEGIFSIFEVAAINTGWPSGLAAASWIAASKFYCGYEVLGSLSYWSLLGKQLILWKKFWPKDKQQSLDKLLTVIFDKCIERVSRRMCNLSYITFILAQNFQVLAILTLIDFIPGKRRSVLEEAFNQNLLGIFLLANILTGLVNMQFDTIAASSTTALAILFSYSFILCIAAGFTAYSSIKMKFW
ncbi:hypothetical protein Syun_019662 [Stephania yunnanensis]|uniref:Uncharacterized protein n=1 Tax=Stephania yunnanensis TaxID=152371 RepID=A0AAP0IV92_9MAGN